MSQTVEAPVATPTAPVKVNKSKHIVQFLREKGIDTPANDVIAALTAQGVNGVTAQLINNIKHRLRANKIAKSARRRRKRTPAPVPAAPVTQVSANEFDQMLQVKALAQAVGGFDKLVDLVEKTRKLAA